MSPPTTTITTKLPLKHTASPLNCLTPLKSEYVWDSAQGSEF